jgi:hypothetical protein
MHDLAAEQRAISLILLNYRKINQEIGVKILGEYK